MQMSGQREYTLTNDTKIKENGKLVFQWDIIGDAISNISRINLSFNVGKK